MCSKPIAPPSNVISACLKKEMFHLALVMKFLIKFTGSSAVIFCMIILAYESNFRPAKIEHYVKYIDNCSIISLKFKHTQSSNISTHSMANHFNIQCIYPTIINQNFNHFGDMYTDYTNIIIKVRVQLSSLLPINSNQSDIIILIVIVTKKRCKNRNDYFLCRFELVSEFWLNYRSEGHS